MVFGALVLAGLLNAQGILRTAEVQDEGLQRDIGLAVARPLADVSGFLRLDRPRSEIRAAFGRSSDSIDTAAVTFPAEAVDGGAATTAPAETGATATTGAETSGGTTTTDDSKPAADTKERFTPAHPLAILAAGDSLAIAPGWALYHIGGAMKVITSAGPVDGRLSTGLERPDFFNWFRHLPAEVRRLKPRVVVVTFGANDNHSYMTGVPGNKDLGEFGSQAWIREYRRRVGGLMDELASTGAYVVWVGIPIARSPTQDRSFRLLNRIYRGEANKRRGRVVFVETYNLMKGPNGGYSDYLETGQGELVKMRLGDGVHYTAAGGERVARAVVRALKREFDLTSWKRSG